MKNSFGFKVNNVGKKPQKYQQQPPVYNNNITSTTINTPTPIVAPIVAPIVTPIVAPIPKREISNFEKMFENIPVIFAGNIKNA